MSRKLKTLFWVLSPLTCFAGIPEELVRQSVEREEPGRAEDADQAEPILLAEATSTSVDVGTYATFILVPCEHLCPRDHWNMVYVKDLAAVL